ncbi:MAG: M20/M25/M40 family metallo-hydrolase [Gemmatimonadales bacterium]
MLFRGSAVAQIPAEVVTTLHHAVASGGVIGLLVATSIVAQEPVEVARRHVENHRVEMVEELRDFLAIPNVASDLPNIKRNAAALVGMMERRGITTRIIETGGAPIVYGEIGDPSLPTIMFYCHYDGQAVDPAEWDQDQPWDPLMRTGPLDDGAQVVPWSDLDRVEDDWRIYARSASDDKAPIVALMHMLDAWQEAGIKLPNRLKFLFEGDEEAGSKYLPGIMREQRELFAADLVVMADGPIHPSGNPTADFGLRGLVEVTLTVYGPIQPIHSGHYGNWAPNPAMRLAQLLATMKGPNGEVLIDGWDDDVIPFGSEEREVLARYPHDDDVRREQLQMGSVYGTGTTRLELVSRPSLNVRGMRSMFIGSQARTIIPDVAVAELDLRLVSGNSPSRQAAKLRRHIEQQGYTVVSETPDSLTRLASPLLVKFDMEATGGYPAGRTPLSEPAARGLITALGRAGLGTPVVSPTMGGSGPAFVYTDILQAPFVVVPTVNHDNNQHARNENVRLGNFFRSVEILAAAATAQVRVVP